MQTSSALWLSVPVLALFGGLLGFMVASLEAPYDAGDHAAATRTAGRGEPPVMLSSFDSSAPRGTRR